MVDEANNNNTQKNVQRNMRENFEANIYTVNKRLRHNILEKRNKIGSIVL